MKYVVGLEFKQWDSRHAVYNLDGGQVRNIVESTLYYMAMTGLDIEITIAEQKGASK